MPAGSLVIVGTGIKGVSHMTVEARTLIERSEKVMFLINEPVTATWIQRLNPAAESLEHLYAAGQRRLDIYRAITAHILAAVRQGMQVCAVFYGHPGVFVTPAHAALAQAQREGYSARMLPGISAEDCLFADLAIDPGYHGCQSFDATDFLVHRRRFDPTSNLILWQIGITGVLYFRPTEADRRGLRLLVEVLLGEYAADHRVALYEAAQYASFDPLIAWLPLGQLPDAPMSTLSTLYVPPRAAAAWDAAVMEQLQIDWADLVWEDKL